MSQPVRVLIYSSQALVRAGFSAMLRAQPHLRVVGDAADWSEPPRVDFDIALVDARATAPRALPFRFLALLSASAAARAWLDAGAAGCILEDATVEELLTALRQAARGETYLPPPLAQPILSSLAPRVPHRELVEPLTERERAVLQLLAHGLSSKDIAQKLYLSVRTLADLHRQPIRYDLAELSRVVADVQPDLLGVEMERGEFERDDLSRAPIESRDALIPLARKSDIVVVPIGAASPEELRAPGEGIRGALVRAMDTTLAAIQIAAGNARRVNSAVVSHACGLICHLEAYTCGTRGRRAWEETNARMLANILAMAQRDPAARILVAVQCRRKHWLEPKLRRAAEIELVNYWEL